MVKRFVAGESVDDAVRATRELTAAGLTVTLDHLGEDTLDAGQADATVKAYLLLLERLSAAGLSSGGRAEVSVKLSAVGQTIDEAMALDKRAAHLRGRAQREHHGHPRHGGPHHDRLDARGPARAAARLPRHRCGAAVLPAPHRGRLPRPRVRRQPGPAVQGGLQGAESVAYQSDAEVDLAYVRCLKVLMAGDGYPMVASHDPRLVAIAGELAKSRPRGPTSTRCSTASGRPSRSGWPIAGETVRVYVPYGDEWYGYLMRRLAERPANVGFFLRALATKS